MGEITPAMALAVGDSSAVKLLLPLSTEPVTVVGVVPDPLPHLVDKLINEHLSGILWYEGAPEAPEFGVQTPGRGQ